MCIFDYDTPQGGARAFYQVLTTTSAGGGFWESFMGTEGTIKISEIASNSAIYREDGAPPWDALVERARTGLGRDAVARWTRAIDLAEFKRAQAPVILRMGERAFGRGRRMPIVARPGGAG